MKITPHSNPEFFVVHSPGQVSEYIRFSIHPVSHRRYEDGRWIVHMSHLMAVVAIGEKRGFVDYSELPDDVQLNLAMHKGRNVALRKDYNPFAVMHLLPTAPSAIVDAVYRALAKIHHPDVGGDEETFKSIVEAYDRIKQRVE